MVGGLCHRVDVANGCASVDMKEAEIEFAAYAPSSGSPPLPHYHHKLSVEIANLATDFAIIQTRKELPLDGKDVKHACLPNEALKKQMEKSAVNHIPAELNVYGWGATMGRIRKKKN